MSVPKKYPFGTFTRHVPYVKRPKYHTRVQQTVVTLTIDYTLDTKTSFGTSPLIDAFVTKNNTTHYTTA